MNYSTELTQLKAKYPHLAVIEVWEKVLFLRMTQGRCVFYSKKGSIFAQLEVGTWVLAADNELEAKKMYKNMAIKLHPDKVKGSHEKFIHLKICYENYNTIRARLGDKYSDYDYESEFYSYQREREDWIRQEYGSYEQYLKRQEKYKQWAKRDMEEFGAPF